jgi:3-deoxy-D-manno-octulosonic acid kinase
VTPPAGFERLDAGAAIWLLRTQARDWLIPFLRAGGTGWAGYERRPLAAGRGGSFAASVAGHEIVVRPCRRGGLVARLLHDTYWGWRPRPFRELQLVEALRRRDVPVVEVHGAGVRWLGPACYRGWLVTRYVRGARTLWEWVSAGGVPAAERTAVLHAVGQAVRRLHDAGARHPDLNLHNILVAAAGGTGPEVWLIDFDRPALAAGAYAGRTADLARLRRSARKLDPAGARLTAADLECIEAAYRC